MKGQAGDGLAVLMGLLLLVISPAMPTGTGLGIHQMAKVIFEIQVFPIAAAADARWYTSD